MAVFLHLISIFLVLLQNSFGHKLVLFVPCIANSQVIFNSRVAETLANAGHDVTMVMITPLDGFDFKRVKIKKEIRGPFLIGPITSGVGCTDEDRVSDILSK
ncbi:hypothetical protein NECAME_06381 [Necator americanus]|uniref:Glucuronosyltransferase n=1 Tax=Necator americanus TaxID=51031 RepID=W2TUF1_NECAM|nr:hypothetical protein NECAME_06381 [Necator americanus]ETN85428.1 hypothetical protein NECAME_06381 [Necator americanus]